MTRGFLVASLAVLVGACSASDEARQRTASRPALEVPGQRTAWAHAPGPTSAIVVLPPGAGEIAQVRERAYANGFGQDITLRGGADKGSNRVEITVAAQAEGGGRGAAPMAKPTEAGVKGEIAARFPGVPMQVVTQPRGNAYGPYGLAVGRQRGGARCLFAWQWIDDIGAAPSGSVRPSSAQAVPASVRVRLCRSDATLDQLAAHMDQLVVDLSRRSAAPAPLEDASRDPPKRTASEARGAGSRSEAGGSGRAPEGRAAPAADIGTTASMAWRADGRRYLAPVQPSRTTAPVSEWARIGRPPGDGRPSGSSGSDGFAGSGAATAVPSPYPAADGSASAAPRRGKALDASLPSRAYLGPGAQAGHAGSAPSSQEARTAAPARTDFR